MHSREQKAALERLASDLRSIRTNAERTLTEVHEDTRIPLEVLRRLEKDLLSTDKMFNDVYVRSILRGYANAVGFSAEEILTAFESATAGSYAADNSLVIATDETSAEVPEEAEPDIVDPILSDSFESSTKEHRSVLSSNSDKEAVDPQAESDRPAISSKQSGKSNKRFSLPKFDFRKGGIGVLVLLSVATGIFVVVRLSGLVEPERESLASEISSTELIPGAREGSAEDTADVLIQSFVMPDTISVSIFTTRGIFDPIRVRIDRDLRRPYWADSTDTLHFRFVNRMIIENHLDRMAISVEDIEYPLDRASSSLQLERDDVQQFLESKNSSGR